MIKVWFHKVKYILLLMVLLLFLAPLINYISNTYHNIITGKTIYFREGRAEPIKWMISDFMYSYFSFITEFQEVDKNERLEKVNFFLNKGKLNYLENVAPVDHRIWQKGYLKYESGEINPIRIRLRGENARNWGFKKKSFKIKTKKKKLYNGYREIYYLNLSDKNSLKNYVPNLFAQEMGILNPFSRLVELYLNNEYLGVYSEVYSTDELFLRKNKIMPVSIFKHSNDISWYFRSFHHGFFNPQLWDRQSKNNMDEDDNRLRMKSFFSNLNQGKENFLDLIDIKEWSTYAAYRLISGDYHSNGLNNIKWVEDNHKGKLSQIIWDPSILLEKYDLSFFNKCETELSCKLNSNPVFRYQKLKEVHKYIFDEKIYDVVKSKIKLEEKRILNSLSLDKNRLEFENDLFLYLKKFFSPKEALKTEIDKIYEYIDNNKNFFELQFSKPIDAKWDLYKNILNIQINGFKPVKKILIHTKGKIKNVYYDVNNNNKIDKKDKKLAIKKINDGLELNLLMFSKQIFRVSAHSHLDEKDAFTPNTHTILFEDNPNIKKITTFDEFTKKKHTLSKVKIENLKFYYDEFINYQDKKFIVISNDLIVKNNIKFEKPVKIKSGVKILIKPNKSIVFKNKVIVEGKKNNPVIFRSTDKESFGTVAIIGKKTEGSILENVVIENGSGALNLFNTDFISMFSIHNTKDIMLKNMVLRKNAKFDDLMHIIYSKNINIENLLITRANLDGIDIDISEVNFKNLNIFEAGNDCLDLMNSIVEINKSSLKFCGDKGVSVGENSNLEINSGLISNSSIGIEVKDNSILEVVEGSFINNKIQINSYIKNWMYGNNGSVINITDTNFSSANTNKFITTKNSIINIFQSTISGMIEKSENVVIK